MDFVFLKEVLDFVLDIVNYNKKNFRDLEFCNFNFIYFYDILWCINN